MIDKIKLFFGRSEFRYLIIGGSSAFIEYVSFLLINVYLYNVVVANVASFIFGFIYSFLLHRVWTFKGSYKHSTNRQLLSYLSLALINILLTSFLIKFQVITVGISPFIAKIVCMVVVVVWNYLLLNRIIFIKND